MKCSIKQLKFNSLYCHMTYQKACSVFCVSTWSSIVSIKPSITFNFLMFVFKLQRLFLGLSNPEIANIFPEHVCFFLVVIISFFAVWFLFLLIDYDLRENVSSYFYITCLYLRFKYVISRCILPFHVIN